MKVFTPVAMRSIAKNLVVAHKVIDEIEHTITSLNGALIKSDLVVGSVHILAKRMIIVFNYPGERGVCNYRSA